MAITNTWAITKLYCHPQHEECENVVFAANWTLEATDGTYVGRTYGIANVDYVEGSFTPFEELTEAQALDWVVEALGEARVAELEALVAQQIQDQAQPRTVTPPLPWSA